MTITKECCWLCRPHVFSTNKGCLNLACPECHTSAGSWEERIAMNIVYQIGDALYEEMPSSVAEHIVRARQATNDKAIDFATKLIREQFIPLADLKKIIEGRIQPVGNILQEGSGTKQIIKIAKNTALKDLLAFLEKPNK